MAVQDRGERSRRSILEAAASVFDERGYDAASTTEILARSGLTRGALYHHFPSKEAIAAALVAAQSEALMVPEHPVRLQAMVDLTLEYARRLRSDPVLRASVRLTVEQSSFNRPGMTPYRQSADAILGLLREAERQGEMLPGVDLEELTQFIVGAFTGVQLMSQVYCGRQDLMARVSTMWRLLLPSIATPGVLMRLRTTPPPSVAGAEGDGVREGDAETDGTARPPVTPRAPWG
ncbi:ScbR family autoregulator-binding transcription factor [Streptomyces rubradiris]|uniref:TetR family transcriptional regulator n=1 Tax=Streptomyces rubradiris TaxID=285531 RepID=A0ABQ3RQU5_STRRR|nr:ScbR family autoregulator-binding transcription factor [Streptomyces rubradiris]GHH24830.1 TetR family transcriptional regulator [Streptomyces rubradiris]GHI58228.1 TetR family transcriptional regulator [Streptomyces rubradiris]